MVCVRNEVTAVSRSFEDVTSGGMIAFRQKGPWMVYTFSKAMAVSQVNYPWAANPLRGAFHLLS